MSTPDDLLTLLREGYAGLDATAPTRVDLRTVLVRGRRARRRQRLALAVPAAVILLVTALTVTLAQHSGAKGGTPVLRADGTVSPTPAASPSAALLPDLGRVGDYVATYVPDTTISPVRTETLVFDAGRCGPARPSEAAFSGCWSPPACVSGTVTGSLDPCNLSLRYSVQPSGPDLVRFGLTNTHDPATAITVDGRPGFVADVDGGHYSYQVGWELADGRGAFVDALNLQEPQVIRFAQGFQFRPIPGHPAPKTRPTPSYSPTPDTPVVDARPTTAPPAVRQLSLPQAGSAKAVVGSGWLLSITQGSGRGAAGFGVNDATGHIHSDAFAYTRVDGQPIPFHGPSPVVVADFTEAGVHHVVASGIAARGTTGVAVLDASGHRGWATLVDPGPDFDCLFWVYETPAAATVTSVETLGAGGAVTGGQRGPYTSDYP